MNKTLKYIVRVFKSLIWFLVLFCIIVAIIVLLIPEYSFDMIFKEGGLFVPGSEVKILILFTAISLIYPSVKYVKKEAFIHGTFEENRDKIFDIFAQMGYVFVKEDNETVTFRLKKKFLRFMRMFEDSITITKNGTPLIIRGDKKEIVRLSDRITYAVNSTDEAEPAQRNDDPFDYLYEKSEENNEAKQEKDEVSDEENNK